MDHMSSTPPKPSCIALIPARSGSKRVPDKNIRPLAGHPLIAYIDLRGAAERRVRGCHRLHRLRGATPSIARELRGRGAVPAPGRVLRRHLAGHRVGGVHAQAPGRAGPALRLLQHPAPHQPLPPAGDDPARLGGVLRGGRGWIRCGRSRNAASTPARCGWCAAGACCPCCRSGRPSSRGTAASTRPCRWSTCRTPAWRSPGRGWCSKTRTIAGNVLMPFLTRDEEGFDVNQPYDWALAEQMVATGAARLPSVEKAR